MHKTGKGLEAREALVHIEEMKKVVDVHGWDGEWFVRAYDHFGEKIGSEENEEGKIFIESQGMCIMAGIGLEDGRARQALDSVKERLDCEYGIVLNNPAFSNYIVKYGEITTYPEGYKENAGIFCHNNPWIMIWRNPDGKRRSGMGLLQEDLPALPGGYQRAAQNRALRILADDRGEGRPYARRG